MQKRGFPQVQRTYEKPLFFSIWLKCGQTYTFATINSKLFILLIIVYIIGERRIQLDSNFSLNKALIYSISPNIGLSYLLKTKIGGVYDGSKQR
jgi:hypothetical protein